MQRARRVALLVVASLALATGCATRDARIARNQEAFDAWPPEVQEQVRAGQIGIGFNVLMVRVALGEPARRAQVVDAARVAEVWTYQKSVPGFGVGVGTGRGRIGTGVTLGEGSRKEDTFVVEFVDGRVERFEAPLAD